MHSTEPLKKSNQKSNQKLTKNSETTPDLEKLADLAFKAKTLAYAPYSHFKVGVCLQTIETQAYFSGCNVENAAYPCSQCAEASALGHMVSTLGPEVKIKFIFLAADTQEPIWPCGGCRQRLVEFSTPETQIFSQTLVNQQSGKPPQSAYLFDLLPNLFSKNLLL